MSKSCIHYGNREIKNLGIVPNKMPFCYRSKQKLSFSNRKKSLIRKETKGIKVDRRTDLEVTSLDVGDIHVVSGGANIFIFFTGENINTDQVNLST